MKNWASYVGREGRQSEPVALLELRPLESSLEIKFELVKEGREEPEEEPK